MSLEPGGPQIVKGVEAPGGVRRRFHWYHKALALLFSFVCFEIGVFLVVFPWLEFWDQNWLATLNPALMSVWSSPYLKGGVTGLGIVNIYISFVEVFRLRRFSEPPQS